ncbi:hypothetical protein ACLMJK_000610 [Lecanora helva]
MPSEDRVRVMMFFYRKKGMSFDDFDLYWRESHSKVACDLPIFRRNILKYEQIHVDTKFRESLRDGGMPVSDYDGIVLLEAASVEKIKEVFVDQEYLDKLKPDEEKFCERTTFQMFPVKTVTILDQTSS